MNKQIKRGFTLIELLVAVLIIGILAAVALPRYQRTVEKSRATQVLTIGKALWNAEEVYRLANGSYTNSLENLDINVTIPTDYTLTNHAETEKKLQFNRNKGNFQYQIIFQFQEKIIYCFTYKTAPKASIDLCKSWGGKDVTTNGDGHHRYTIQ